MVVLRGHLQSLQQTHSSLQASSDQLSATHRRSDAQLAEQLRARQEELSRTRAQVSTPSHPHTLTPSHPKQVSSLSIELMAEKNVSEELRNQLTLARANLARHRSQTSSSPSQSTPYPAIADSKPPPVTPASNPRPPGSGAGSKKALVINL